MSPLPGAEEHVSQPQWEDRGELGRQIAPNGGFLLLKSIRHVSRVCLTESVSTVNGALSPVGPPARSGAFLFCWAKPVRTTYNQF